MRRYVSALHPIWVWALCVSLWWAPHTVQGAIYACPTDEGSTVFQDRPCPLKPRKVAKAKLIQRLPFGIHASWFEVPGQAEGRAFCDRRGCECGAVERRHEGSLSRAVADALYMDGGWHRYEMSYQMWLRTPTSSGENHERRTEMIEAACNVMMSQQLLREYAEEVASRLRQQMLAAEERGYDEPEPCEMGIQGACKYYDAVLLYRRLLADSRALTISREEISATALPLDQ